MPLNKLLLTFCWLYPLASIAIATVLSVFGITSSSISYILVLIISMLLVQHFVKTNHRTLEPPEIKKVFFYFLSVQTIFSLVIMLMVIPAGSINGSALIFGIIISTSISALVIYLGIKSGNKPLPAEKPPETD